MPPKTTICTSGNTSELALPNIRRPLSQITSNKHPGIRSGQSANEQSFQVSTNADAKSSAPYSARDHAVSMVSASVPNASCPHFVYFSSSILTRFGFGATHSISARRTLACMRVRALATATAETTTSASSSSPPPPPSASPSSSTPAPSPSDPALHRIVDDISALTLLQAADLVTLLKVKCRKKPSFQNRLTTRFFSIPHSRRPAHTNPQIEKLKIADASEHSRDRLPHSGCGRSCSRCRCRRR